MPAANTQQENKTMVKTKIKIKRSISKFYYLHLDLNANKC